MKYGKTERISGIVILLALAAILVPWLMSDPAPREEQPQPSFTIEQPVDVPRHEVPAPEQPDSIGRDTSIIDTAPLESATSPADGDEPASESESQTAALPEDASPDSQPQTALEKKTDPIAELMQGDGAPKATPSGEWAVQVGSFGQADNAKRLTKELEEKGFRVYTRARNNDLTTVLVGPFASSEDGERARALVKERANQQGLLIRVKD
ncbi:SPOR domain-containing protein [Vreelandella subglaciescola]|jgi:DedD protein|uniref:DedD protein n=1 Tax=Vreelandella subglaciescola TaxID=29571 RepID=A0A1M7EB11_9GAMM|nr:SPOR domain-containing protein [Halomonas subglaciescola]SHL88945.1 DedD protein [Halomonas subglaciescola]